MKAKSLRTLLPHIIGGTLLSRRFSVAKTASFLAFLVIMTLTRSGIAQPLNKAAQSSLDIAYQLAGAGMIKWSATAFQDVVKNAPESVEALMLGGLALFAVGDERQAGGVWQKAETLGEESASALLGDVRFRQGDLDGAQVAYERAVASLPRAAKARVGLALIAEKRGHLDEAIDHIRPLIEPPADEEAESHIPMIDAYYHLGRFYLANGQPADALGILKTGTQLNTRHPQMHLLLAMAYEQSGLIAESTHLYERALQLDPDLGAAKEGLERLRR